MNKLNSNTEFQVGSHNIGYLDSDFPVRFPNVDFAPRTLGSFQKLTRRMNDAEIESTLKPGLCELGDVLALLDNAPSECKDGYSNIFYIKDSPFVVFVLWRDSYWRVHAWLRRGVGWFAGERVFSPATPSDTGSAQNSALESSDPLILPNILIQLTRIADALEKPTHVIMKKGKKK